MNKEDIKTLIEKYYKAETSLEEEELLREYFSKKKNRDEDPELADLLMLFSEYETSGNEEELNISPAKQKQVRMAFPWYYSAAAAVAFLLVGIFVGKSWEQNETNASQIANLNKELREIKSLISYHQVERMSPSERIQVAYQFEEQDSLDQETVNTLIDILQFDANINVRLAATDALVKIKNNDKVRAAFLNSLKAETNPMLQVKLIDALVLSKEKKAIPEFQRIMQATDQNQTVKERAAYGITQLI